MDAHAIANVPMRSPLLSLGLAALASAESRLDARAINLISADSLQSRLENLLATALIDVGLSYGEIALIEGADDNMFVNRYLTIERGAVVLGTCPKRSDFEPVAMSRDLRGWVMRLAASEDGCITDLDPSGQSPGFALGLYAEGANRTHAMAMRVGGRVIGWVAVVYFDTEMVASDRVDRLRLLTDQMTIAVEVTRLAEQAHHASSAQERASTAQARVDELLRANAAIRSSLDLIAESSETNHVLGKLLCVMAEQLSCSAASICLRAPGSDHFEVEYVCLDGEAKRWSPAVGTLQHFLPNHHAVWRALIEQGCTADHQSSDPRTVSLDLADTPGSDGTLLALPLIQKGEVIGAVTFRYHERKSLSEAESGLLETLAFRATLAVQFERMARRAQVRSQVAATLAERARIARELHDTYAQGFTGVLMHLQASQRAGTSAQAHHHVNEALEAARGALVDARRSVHALRSAAERHAPFARTLKGVFKTLFAGSHVATVVIIEPTADLQPRLFSEHVENELLRIAQEAATNTIKHARASLFEARIRRISNAIELIFTDDGVGFGSGAVDDGFGLLGMHERAARIGATLRIESREPRGTRIELSIPTIGAQRMVSDGPLAQARPGHGAQSITSTP